MKKIAFICLGIILFNANNYAQSKLSQLKSNTPETYVNISLDKNTLSAIAENFVIDKVRQNTDGLLDVTIWLPARDFDKFEQLNIPYSILEQQRAFVTMAYSYDQLVENWNRYPTYSTYLQTMEKFQQSYPELCKIDTVLASTPNNHSILCAHISNNVGVENDKPSVFYSSTMHGDEVVGYYFLLRLIDKLLSEYDSDTFIHNLVDNVDIWICPLHNPDGTYYTSNNQINESPISTRSNANGIDINRTFPLVTQPVKSNYEPEVEAMMQFFNEHNFTIAANLHGGAEVFNYPWDSWMTWQKEHADIDWWEYVGRSYADTCHKYSYNYMQDEDGGVTPGGDWYVITGSMQDYHNYYRHTRHVTIEVGPKVLHSIMLPNYWNYAYRSLLNFIGEADFGVHGIITDSLTGEPLKATIYVENHDKDHSEVESSLPFGDYHRPIKAGNYSLTYSAEGYLPKTIEVGISDGEKLVVDVALTKNSAVPDYETTFTVFPNPATDIVKIECDVCDEETLVEIFDESNRLVAAKTINRASNIDVSILQSGVYTVRIHNKNQVENKKLILLRK